MYECFKQKPKSIRLLEQFNSGNCGILTYYKQAQFSRKCQFWYQLSKFKCDMPKTDNILWRWICLWRHNHLENDPFMPHCWSFNLTGWPLGEINVKKWDCKEWPCRKIMEKGWPLKDWIIDPSDHDFQNTQVKKSISFIALRAYLALSDCHDRCCISSWVSYLQI